MARVLSAAGAAGVGWFGGGLAGGSAPRSLREILKADAEVNVSKVFKSAREAERITLDAGEELPGRGPCAPELQDGEPRPVVLVADDEPTTRRMLREELEPRGFWVVEAEGGEEAWKRFQHELPDLVITDLRMPAGDGVELVRRIRREAKSWVPVIVVTSQTDLDIFPMAVKAAREAATEVLHLRRDLPRVAELAQSLSMRSVGEARRQKRLSDMRSILAGLPECGGNVSKLARLTEIPRSTIYHLLREMNLLDQLEDER